LLTWHKTWLKERDNHRRKGRDLSKTQLSFEDQTDQPIPMFNIVTKDLICTSLGFRTVFSLDVQLSLVLNEQAKEFLGVHRLLLDEPVGKRVEDVNVLV